MHCHMGPICVLNSTPVAWFWLAWSSKFWQRKWWHVDTSHLPRDDQDSWYIASNSSCFGCRSLWWRTRCHQHVEPNVRPLGSKVWHGSASDQCWHWWHQDCHWWGYCWLCQWFAWKSRSCNHWASWLPSSTVEQHLGTTSHCLHVWHSCWTYTNTFLALDWILYGGLLYFRDLCRISMIVVYRMLYPQCMKWFAKSSIATMIANSSWMSFALPHSSHNRWSLPSNPAESY